MSMSKMPQRISSSSAVFSFLIFLALTSIRSEARQKGSGGHPAGGRRQDGLAQIRLHRLPHDFRKRLLFRARRDEGGGAQPPNVISNQFPMDPKGVNATQPCRHSGSALRRPTAWSPSSTDIESRHQRLAAKADPGSGSRGRRPGYCEPGNLSTSLRAARIAT